MSFSPALAFYRAATAALWPLASPWLNARARNGKEDSARLGERFGRYAQPRPSGPLVWLHGASVGESGVALQLIEALNARRPELSFVLSTGTRTSATLVARRAPPRTTHIYAPLDRARAVRGFFAHWRPDLGIFVESELWPNLILQAERTATPLALVNARMSPASLRRWASWSTAGKRLLRPFAYVSAADMRTGNALSRLRGSDVPVLGNLKLAAPAPHIDMPARAALEAEIGGRPVWLAASTHPGEDAIVLAAHERLRAEFSDALLIIAPRHPERGGAIAALAGDAPRRSQGAPIGNASVYVADTMGELGLFYDLAPIALVAGSLSNSLKGHNPVEPAKLGAAIVTGPFVESFEELFGTLVAAGGASIVHGDTELARAVAALWRDEAARVRQSAVAQDVVAQGDAAFGETIDRLAALLPREAADARA
ncbi:MAG: 3-deoxy-D-manno-octulosonic acid transferase [Terricaulis sp.]